jgi:hypothetical protein
VSNGSRVNLAVLGKAKPEVVICNVVDDQTADIISLELINTWFRYLPLIILQRILSSFLGRSPKSGEWARSSSSRYIMYCVPLPFSFPLCSFTLASYH